MSSPNPLLWPRPPVIWSYGIAVLSVTAALTISRWPELHLQDAPVSLFLCAVILSAWFGDLKETVQEVQRTNEALQAESRERKRAEEASRQAQAELARASRVTTMGEMTASLAHEVNQPIGAAVTNANTCVFAGWRATPQMWKKRARLR